MTVNQNHQVLPGQVKLERLTCGIVECNDSQEFKWQIALEEVNCQKLISDHARFAVDYAELFNWVLADVVEVFYGAAHV